MVQFNVCRLEEEANTVQKLNIEKSTADTKLKEMEGQITVHEDNIGKVCVLYYKMIHCTCAPLHVYMYIEYSIYMYMYIVIQYIHVHLHVFSVPFTYNALYIVIQYNYTCTDGIIKHVQCVNVHLNMYIVK